MVRYDRVTYKPEGAKRAVTVYLRDVTDLHLFGAKAISGIEVTREGETVDRYHLISGELVTKREEVHMDLHYGDLR